MSAAARAMTCVAILLGLAASPGPSHAHRLAPSLFEVRELGGGEIEVRWRTPLVRPAGASLRPVLPGPCAPSEEPRAARAGNGIELRWRARCEGESLVGASLRVEGLAESGTAALVRVALRDGRTLQAILSGDASEYTVPERESAARVFAAYLRLGAAHIAGGFDHLLFVMGLLLLVRGWRRLVATVTAFTVGHSVTLSLAALGFAAFPPAPVEVAIAASVWLLGVELARDEGAKPSLLRRHPWPMALAFGLLHGLGFAGALREAGLPADEVPLALLGFNVGIELGQLAFVGVVLAARRLLAPALARIPRWLAAAPAYAIGSLAAYWCFDRIAVWLAGPVD